MNAIHFNDESDFNKFSKYITQSKTRLDALHASLSKQSVKAVRESLEQLEGEFNSAIANRNMFKRLIKPVKDSIASLHHSCDSIDKIKSLIHTEEQEQS